MTQTKFKLLINCFHKECDCFAKAREENLIRSKIARLLNKEGYTYVIVDGEYVKKHEEERSLQKQSEEIEE